MASLRNAGKQSTAGQAGIRVKDWRSNTGQTSCETGLLLAGWACSRCDARTDGEDTGRQAGKWLVVWTMGDHGGSALAARGCGDIRHAVLGYATSLQRVHEKGHVDGHNDSQDVVRREKADQKKEGDDAED